MLVVAALALAGCATPAMRIKHNQELFASLSAKDQELVKQGRIELGFTPDMVKLALGEPDYVIERTDSTGTTQIWRYVGYDASADSHLYGVWGFGPYYSPFMGYRYYGWSGYYARGYVQRPQTDYMRVTFRGDRVVEIDKRQ